MNIQAIRKWFNTEWPRLLAMAHYNREYMYLPEPIGENSKFGHEIISQVFEIFLSMPYKQSNVIFLRYVLSLPLRDISAITGLTTRRNQQLLNIA
ncbi:DNA-directed RNA polymerase specialized sigma24 family protein [Weissella uvarum]|uniref:sigma-70 family RNA polymerase sigma factor n=1 Tax=Weissella uvarum TaxID=1479233 RepID=UPI0019615DA9|nr:sigma-70 family RNA polymerase sigma factor [Weissella uvarum]MBM7616619.1 DNA-directed RNA polymerase specialized sigma24 family protein [Weissella uvarum]MCM0594923.1 sigma-70 family RNA polymerase sigma factor [Weissella uvarum]